jgi:hypothetical protein
MSKNELLPLYEGRDYYALNDYEPSGMIKVLGDDLTSKLIEAHKLNSEGFGIFWCVNKFKGARKTENLDSLVALYIDMEGDSKTALYSRLKRGLTPSYVIETKNGFHAYWLIYDYDLETYKDDLAHRLQPFYNSDRKAMDVSRVLRVPDFFHLKDPSDPFLIRCLEYNPCIAYSPKSIADFYPNQIEEKDLELKHEFSKDMNKKFSGQSDFFDRVYNMNCLDALKRLSGSPHVMGEIYDFRKTSNGNHNILVNGKSTSCFLDKNYRIGSTDKGGPTIWQWLYWYHQDHKHVYRIMKEVFHELWEGLEIEPRTSEAIQVSHN